MGSEMCIRDRLYSVTLHVASAATVWNLFGRRDYSAKTSCSLFNVKVSVLVIDSPERQPNENLSVLQFWPQLCIVLLYTT